MPFSQFADLHVKQDIQPVSARFHRERGNFLIAAGRLHLKLIELAACFDHDIKRTEEFLRALTTDNQGFNVGTVEFQLCDKLCSEILDGTINEDSSGSDIIAILTSA